MLLLDQIAEQRIREAMERGEFDDLPGQGEPIDLDDDSMVPEDLRMAWRILRNAGFVPPEVALRREIRDAEELLAAAAGDEDRGRAARRLRYLRSRLELEGGRRTNLLLEEVYRARVAARLARE